MRRPSSGRCPWRPTGARGSPRRRRRGCSRRACLRRSDTLPTPAWMTPAFSTLNCTSPPLAALDRGGHVHRHGADLGVRHQVARAEDLAQAADERHHVRRRDAAVELDLAAAGSISIRSSAPTMSAPAALASSALAPRANTATRTVLPVPFGRLTDAADHLVGVARVDAEVHRDFDASRRTSPKPRAFIELHGLLDREVRLALEGIAGGAGAFCQALP